MKREQLQATDASAGSGGRRGPLRRLGLVAAVASALALLGATAAQASTVTVGSVLPTSTEQVEFKEVQTLFNTALPEAGANLVSPVNGAIVLWRVVGAEGGPFTLRVLHPNGKGGYSAHGSSAPVTPADTGLQSFAANIPVETGDLIGIDPTKGTDKIGAASAAGASFASIFPTPIEGATVPARPAVTGQEIELSAEVQPTPTITAVSPFSGSVAGGTTVAITGRDFKSASTVKFGATPASTFTVDSDTQITATAPPSATVGRVDVTATTVAGTSAAVSADRFNYEGCVVPKLKGTSLKTSRRKLRRADCKLGNILGTKGKTSKVLNQNPKVGKVLAPGSKVNVRVGPVSHHRSH
jgi:IPT/TIG domain-containing protein/PASTA domain-containing protein